MTENRSPDKNKKKIYLTDAVLEFIGDRTRSQAINLNLLRMDYATSQVHRPTPSEFEFYRETIAPKFAKVKYPDQKAIILEFAEFTGRSFLESIVVLEMIESQINKT